MASLEQLVGSPTLRPLVAYVARPRVDPVVERVALVEELADIERVKQRAIVLLSRRAAEAARTYRFDVALRTGRSRDVAALVLAGSEAALMTATAARIADRSGTAILASGDDVDLAELTVAISRELAGGADAVLLRTHAALRAIQAHPLDGSADGIVEHAAKALGVPIELVEDEPEASPRAAVSVEGHVEAWLSAPPQDGDLAMGLDIALQVASSAVSAALLASRRAEELPIQSRAEVLTELLGYSPSGRSQLVRRARAIYLEIDSWHVAVRLEFEELADSGPSSAFEEYETRARLTRAALDAVTDLGGTWHSARAGTALMLVNMHREDPGSGASRDVATVMERALPRIRSQLPTTLIRCGVGSAHQGPRGLASSGAEAKAALAAARAAGRVNAAVPYDSVGLRRSLVEWYASDVAREAVTSVLAPLSDLKRARAEQLITTLHVYLDHQCSLSKAAKTLNLHRNAVSYRVKQAFELLDVDQDNPDDLLLLQLACRSRELS